MPSILHSHPQKKRGGRGRESKSPLFSIERPAGPSFGGGEGEEKESVPAPVCSYSQGRDQRKEGKKKQKRGSGAVRRDCYKTLARRKKEKERRLSMRRYMAHYW